MMKRKSGFSIIDEEYCERNRTNKYQITVMLPKNIAFVDLLLPHSSDLIDCILSETNNDGSQQNRFWIVQ